MRHLPARRHFLGGLGVAVMLPHFESLRMARAQTPARKQRLITIFLPDGVLMEEWIPSKVGADFDLPPHFAPLASFRKKLLILSGLSNFPGKPDNGTGDHACGTAAAFTASPPRRGDGALIKNGISVDQAAAAVLKQNTRIASLQLGLEDGATSGDCEFGFSCVYENCISWASDTQALPKTVSPSTVFDQIFAGFDPNATAATKAQRLARKSSVLDYVRGEASSLSAKLGPSDRAKLDQLLSGVRDLEKQIQTETMGAAPNACASMPRPAATMDQPTRARLMNGLIATAFQCDVTRVVSHMLGHAFPSRAYAFIGVNAKHHDASHYGDDLGKEDYRKIVNYNLGLVADLLARLEAIPEDSGTALDNTMVVLTSDCGESRGHDHSNLPVLVAGGAGRFRMGRHVAYQNGQTLSSLYLSVLRAFGATAASFGADGRAPLSDLE
jgi:hypothetical protein